ncbi:MAG: DUF3955 domain-containing protein [bacterium]|nr:DUF3955 domain-containing protein [bacterium]
MEKNLYVIIIFFILAITCIATYNIIGVEVAEDGRLIESFGFIPLALFFSTIGVISAMDMGIRFFVKLIRKNIR